MIDLVHNITKIIPVKIKKKTIDKTNPTGSLLLISKNYLINLIQSRLTDKRI